MNPLQSTLLSGAAAFTLATSAAAETTPQSIAFDSAEKVTLVLADTTSSGGPSWGEVFVETAVWLTFGALMYKVAFGNKR